jgi:DNA invertase Pin-like site-specific DNA recombinase
LRCHFAFISARAGYPRFFKASSTPSMSRSWILRLALLSSLAKVEAQKISERTKAGMARAKANGTRIGRPKLGVELRQQIARRASKGETPYAIAKALGIDHHTVAKYAG